MYFNKTRFIKKRIRKNQKAFLQMEKQIRETVDLEHTVLHVMTEAYTFGGHTRCVERWIQQLPELKHSCVVLSQHAPFPPQLNKICLPYA